MIAVRNSEAIQVYLYLLSLVIRSSSSLLYRLTLYRSWVQAEVRWKGIISCLVGGKCRLLRLVVRREDARWNVVIAAGRHLASCEVWGVRAVLTRSEAPVAEVAHPSSFMNREQTRVNLLQLWHFVYLKRSYNQSNSTIVMKFGIKAKIRYDISIL